MSFINDDKVVVYTREQVYTLFKNYNFDLAAIDKNFYKNYVESMYLGYFCETPPKSYTKKKMLELLLDSCLAQQKYEKSKNTIIDITK